MASIDNGRRWWHNGILLTNISLVIVITVHTSVWLAGFFVISIIPLSAGLILNELETKFIDGMLRTGSFKIFGNTYDVSRVTPIKY